MSYHNVIWISVYKSVEITWIFPGKSNGKGQSNCEIEYVAYLVSVFCLDASHLFMNVSCERNRNGQNLRAFLFVSDISRCIGLKFGILFYNHFKKNLTQWKLQLCLRLLCILSCCLALVYIVCSVMGQSLSWC